MRSLIAGLGNVFHGDDGVGVAVAAAVAAEPQPPGTEVRDIGVRGVHLAYELLDGYDLVVLIDAVQRGGRPGSVHVVEHAARAREAPAVDGLMDAHDMAPDEVLALVPALGGTLGRVVVVGCEVASVQPCAELSDPVRAAVPLLARTALDVVWTAHREADRAARESTPHGELPTGIGGP